ncbi:hypothetical protein U1Q18_009867 [Sarracenia purpurea var. burkii]
MSLVVWGRAIRKSALWILTKLGWTLEKMKLFHACVHALRARLGLRFIAAMIFSEDRAGFFVMSVEIKWILGFLAGNLSPVFLSIGGIFGLH